MAAVARDEKWDEDYLPEPEIIQNPDNTKTIISYRINPETGKKIRVTQKVKEIKMTEKVNHAVAERKKWAKYGLEKGSPAGPNFNTTSIGENIAFRPSLKKESVDEEDKEEEKAATISDKLSKKPGGFVCRLCGGEHMTMKCPYKDVLGEDPTAEESAGDLSAGPGGDSMGGPGGANQYVPPHLRNRLPGAADPGRSIGLNDQEEEISTVRITNLSQDVIEDDLRGLFGRAGRITRCHLSRDHQTQRSRGFAFVSYESRRSAEEAVERLNGFRLDHLVIGVEFAKR